MVVLISTALGLTEKGTFTSLLPEVKVLLKPSLAPPLCVTPSLSLPLLACSDASSQCNQSARSLCNVQADALSWSGLSALEINTSTRLW